MIRLGWDKLKRLLEQTWTGKRLILPQKDEAATPTLAFGDGDTGFYEAVDDNLYLSFAGVVKYFFSAGRISTVNGTGILNEAPTATNPVLAPNVSDLDTGIGLAASDALSAIAGGVEGMRWTEASRTIEINATVAETDGGKIRIVTVATHGLIVGDVVQFAAGSGTLATNITASTNYYVIEVDDVNKFNISATKGGTGVTYSSTVTAFTSYELVVTIAADSDLVTKLQGNSIDIVQASDLNIASTATMSLVFAFEPTKIVLDWSGNAVHDTSSEAGHSAGRTVVLVTAKDTVTHNMNATSLNDANGTLGINSTQNDTTNAILVHAGADGSDQGTITGAVTSWTTSTHTLLITFTTANTTDASNFVEVVATAYK